MSVSIAALVIVFSTHAIVYFVTAGSDLARKTQALFLAEEALEVARFVRDEDWGEISALTPGNTYYLDVGTSSASIVGSPEVIGEFTRSIVVEEVSRSSGNDDIVPNGMAGSAVDSGTVLLTAYVSWGNGTTSLSTYLADIFNL